MSQGANYYDWWQAGTYVDGPPNTVPSFNATPAWEDLFQQRVVDRGFFYASKDGAFPSKGSGGGGTRRINWGWAILGAHQSGGGGPQSLPRTVTFNPVARVLEQAPTEELEALRGPPVVSRTNVAVAAGHPTALGLAPGVAKRSEIVATFQLPTHAATFGIALGDPASMGGPPGMAVSRMMANYSMNGYGGQADPTLPANPQPSDCQARCDADPGCQLWTFQKGAPAGHACTKTIVDVDLVCPTGPGPWASQNTDTVLGYKNATRLPGCAANTSYLLCSVQYTPPTNASVPFHNVPVTCGGATDVLRLLPTEKTLEIRLFSDWNFVEAFFQRGRVAMTVPSTLPQYPTGLSDLADLALTVTGAAVTAAAVDVFPMKGIWASPEQVKAAPRVYP